MCNYDKYGILCESDLCDTCVGARFRRGVTANIVPPENMEDISLRDENIVVVTLKNKHDILDNKDLNSIIRYARDNINNPDILIEFLYVNGKD